MLQLLRVHPALQRHPDFLPLTSAVFGYLHRRLVTEHLLLPLPTLALVIQIP